MKTPWAAKLYPNEVRAIRRKLALTQEQAGKIIGGGKKAFAKYENNVIQPSASMRILLRLLYKHPELLKVLIK